MESVAGIKWNRWPESSGICKYDSMGNIRSHTDFNGETITYTYSPCCGKLEKKTFPDGTTEDYTYTATGQVETVTTYHGITSYHYDLRDRVARVDNLDGTSISYSYDDAGNRTSITIPSGTTFYTFDKLNRLATVTDPDGGLTSYTYDLVGNRQSVTLPGGTITSYVYNALNRLTYMENRAANSSLLSSYTYTLELAGNRTHVVENTGRTVDYTYDVLYRLVQEEIFDTDLTTSIIGYAYDQVGNRLAKVVDGIEVATYSYDANDRMLTDGVASYSYDANGNLLNKTDKTGIVDYTFDYQNRLVRMATPANIFEYAYNHDGIRFAKWMDGVETGYLVDSNRSYAQVLEEYAGANLTASYVYGDDLLSRNDGAWSHYIYDGQLSTRQLVNGAGAVTDSYDYDAFGELLNSVGTTPNNYLYTGEQYDAGAEMYYLRARYYDQSSGRFLGMDTWGGSQTEPVTLHKYLYANVNPVMMVDPSGEMSLIGISTGLATLGILTHIAYQQLSVSPVKPKLMPGTDPSNWLFIYHAVKASRLALERVKTREKIKRKSRGRSVLFHYTGKYSALGISMFGAAFASDPYRGRLAGGNTRPGGFYATDIPPWDLNYTQLELSAMFYGGNKNKPVNWFVAVDGTSFEKVWGTGHEYVLQGTGTVDLDVITIGPNLMYSR